MSLVTCLTMWSGLAFGQAEILPHPPVAPPPPVPAIALPADITPEQRAHIEQAIERLRDGGLPQIANQLDAALQSARQNELRRTLSKKESQLKALQREIAALQRQVQGEPILFECKVIRIDGEKLREQNPALYQQVLQRQEQPGRPRPLQRSNRSTPTASTQELLRQLLDCKGSGAVSIESAPKIVTHDGQEARIHIGGQLPVPVGMKNGAITEYMDFGTKICVQPKLIDSDTVQCRIRYEQAEPVPGNGVVHAGVEIPRMKMFAVNSQVTMKFGETAMVGSPLTSESTIAVFFATVGRLNQPAVTLDTPAPRPSFGSWTTDLRPHAVLPSPVCTDAATCALEAAASPKQSQQWISPISLLMRTLLQTDTRLYDSPIEVPPAPLPEPPLPQREPMSN